MQKKLRVAVLLGGISNEREISLSTGKQIAKNLDRKKYSVSLYDTKTQLKKLFSNCQNKKIDLCFLALHGKGGEDGTIQGMLDLLGIKYTGSGVLASAICIDKVKTKQILNDHNIDLPKGIAITKGEWLNNKSTILKKIKYPCFVKPNNAGSSVGISLVKTKNTINKAVNLAFSHDNLILIEELIKGTEISVPVLGDQALPVAEICPKNEFFDYDAKYSQGKCEDIVPARISPKMAKIAQNKALIAHKATGCRGMTRSDFIIKSNKCYFLEINTIPGMTPTSLCPQSAAAQGINFSQLLDKIIQLALDD